MGSRAYPVDRPAPKRPVPRLHVLVDADVVPRLPLLKAMVERGAEDLAIQLRDPSAHGRAIWDAAVELRSIHPAALVLVNDRVDVGLGAGASGVHLKETSMSPADVRRLVSPDLLIGRSVHDLAGVERWGRGEVRGAVNYLVLGSVAPTASHPGDEPLPEEAVREAPSHCGVPLLAIGGVTPTLLDRLCSWGYHGAVVRSGVWGATDPLEALSAYLQILSRHPSVWNQDGDD